MGLRLYWRLFAIGDHGSLWGGRGALDDLAAGSSPTMRLRLTAPLATPTPAGSSPTPAIVYREPCWMAPGSPDPMRRRAGTRPARGGCRLGLYPPTPPSPSRSSYTLSSSRGSPLGHDPDQEGGGGRTRPASPPSQGYHLPGFRGERKERGVGRAKVGNCLPSFYVTLMWQLHHYADHSASTYPPRGLTNHCQSYSASATFLQQSGKRKSVLARGSCIC